MFRCRLKSFSTWKTIWFIFTHSLYFFFPQSNDVLTVTRWDKRDDNSHFLREESERLFENSESLTRGKCCFFCCRLKIFFKRTIAVLFSSQCFPIPRVVVKKSFSTRKTIWFIFTHSLYFFFPQSNDVLTVTARWHRGSPSDGQGHSHSWSRGRLCSSLTAYRCLSSQSGIT